MYSGQTTSGNNDILWFWGNVADHELSSLYINVLSSRSFYYASRKGDVYTSSGVWTANTWTHVAVTYAGGVLNTTSLKIYVDGVQQSTTFTGIAITPNFSDTNYVIGAHGTASGYNFLGQLDGVRFYNKALSSNEIYNAYYTNTIHATNSIENRLSQ